MPIEDATQNRGPLEVVSGFPPISDAATTFPNSPAGDRDSRPEQMHQIPVIEGYAVMREVSRGGQGAVFECIRKTTGRRVAVKVLSGGAFISDQQKTRFNREVQILAGLEHPNIVRVIDRGTAPDGSLFLVMDFVDGLSLDQFVNLHYQKHHPEGPPPADPSDLLRLFVKVCGAVNAAHLKGIVHRDLKPSNIRVTENGEPYILDFGLARAALMTLETGDRATSLTGEFMGTIAYASPEQAEGHHSKVDSRADVYSLGVILYKMMTRRFPYDVSGTVREVLNNIVHGEPVPPSKLFSSTGKKSGTWKIGTLRIGGRGSIDPILEAIVLKALSKDRSRRYQHAGDFGNDVANYLAGRVTVAHGERRRPAGTKRWRFIAAGVAVAITVLGGLWWTKHGEAPAVSSMNDPHQPQTEADDPQRLSQIERFAIDSKLASPQTAPPFSSGDWNYLNQRRRRGSLATRISASVLSPDANTDALIEQREQEIIASHAGDDFSFAMDRGRRWFFEIKRPPFEKAIPYFEHAVAIQPSSVEARHYLVESLICAHGKDRASNLTRAIEVCEATLKLVPLHSAAWAQTQVDLGNAWFNLPAKDPSPNLQKSLGAYTAALMVYTQQGDPDHWSLIQTNLARVLYFQTGDQPRNYSDALAACNRALTVRTRTTQPAGWAVTQNILGMVYAKLPGDAAKNMQQAIDAFEAALEVRTLEDDPYWWAETQINLGNALSAMPAKNRAPNLHRAINAFEGALQVDTRGENPSMWAVIQINLGFVWSALAQHDRDPVNQRHAIEAFQSALEIYSQNNDPYRWAATQYNLGCALTDPVLPVDEILKNRQDARSALNSALIVFTQAAYPTDRANTLRHLGMLDDAPPVTEH